MKKIRLTQKGIERIEMELMILNNAHERLYQIAHKFKSIEENSPLVYHTEAAMLFLTEACEQLEKVLD